MVRYGIEISTKKRGAKREKVRLKKFAREMEFADKRPTRERSIHHDPRRLAHAHRGRAGGEEREMFARDPPAIATEQFDHARV